jgi:hypothetical protein
MRHPERVVALPGYKLEISYPDGVSGIIDLSNSVGRGVFAPLKNESFFSKVHVGEFGQIAWTNEIEICADAAFLEITGKYSRQLAHA